jgi:hypothetical protein
VASGLALEILNAGAPIDADIERLGRLSEKYML